MLGNFSFGDYFKEGAIELAWTVASSRELGLPRRLMVTVHASDEEAAGLWKKIAGLPDEPDRADARHDNFWSMGDTGPCGPCTEIFYDHGEHVAGGPPGSPDEDGDRFVEIWNLVFMQFEQFADGARARPAASPAIDTGMGLERIDRRAAGRARQLRHRPLPHPDRRQPGADRRRRPPASQRPSHRVIADHLRATAFLIADGVEPVQRGPRLCAAPDHAPGHAPRLPAGRARAADAPPGPDPGRARWAAPIPNCAAPSRRSSRPCARRRSASAARSAAAWPCSTRRPRACGRRRCCRRDGVQALRHLRLSPRPDPGRGARQGHPWISPASTRPWQRQRAMARESWAGSGQQAQGARVAGAARAPRPDPFRGYDDDRGRRRRCWPWSRTAPRSSAAEAGETRRGAVRRTPFYAESGGQAGDRGARRLAGRRAPRWSTSRKEAGDLHVHVLKITRGPAGARRRRATWRSTPSARARTRLNHSAAHLVHAALRHVLGPHVAQKGQLVDGERMRFDFSHGAPLTPAEIDAIETEVNAVIRQNLPADTEEMAPAGGDRGRRRRPVRREVRRQRARADARAARSTATAPIRSSCAAAPTWRAPAISPSSRSSPSRGSPPACGGSRR